MSNNYVVKYSADALLDDLYMEHHGVKGQKWHVKHGPPYPLRGDNLERAKIDWRSNKSSGSNKDKATAGGFGFREIRTKEKIERITDDNAQTSSAYKSIKPENGMTPSAADDFWKNMFRGNSGNDNAHTTDGFFRKSKDDSSEYEKWLKEHSGDSTTSDSDSSTTTSETQKTTTDDKPDRPLRPKTVDKGDGLTEDSVRDIIKVNSRDYDNDEKWDAISTANIHKIKKYASSMTDAEIKEALNRVDLMARIDSKMPTESPKVKKLDAISTTMKDVEKYATNALNFYNFVADVHNSFGSGPSWKKFKSG